ncbi:PREDICTED: uncharacterized protein LOC104716563 isoform X2 [Camelina sativa]|uniref:Uncharacterized protein LOC104716563 isoform X2 n=1 Tax=Camelina sativa TaxID=90675 RepID=A0ABM0TVX2_CAMSA|nr:PREDICTED: uncharacterized protein LOC104716563 isoform X2 [Camelina sativa]
MELPGSLFGSLKPPVSGASGGLIRAIFQNLRRSWYVDVEGFDTSLSADEIKEALMNHFKSCGAIARVFLNTNPETNVVDRFDNSLPLDEIKEALNNHFKSCGVTARVFLNTNPETNVVDSHASIAIMGDDVDEKVKELDRSELGGRKLIVKPAQLAPKVIIRDVPFA